MTGETEKPFRGRIDGWSICRIKPDDQSAYEDRYGPNLGYVVVGHFLDHPYIKGREAWGAQTSLVVKREGTYLETLNSIYELVGPMMDDRKSYYARD